MPSDFALPDGAFLVGSVDGLDVACGGVCHFDAETAEIRRMYVVPERRGAGFSRRVLGALVGGIWDAASSRSSATPWWWLAAFAGVAATGVVVIRDQRRRRYDRLRRRDAITRRPTRPTNLGVRRRGHAHGSR